MRHLFTMSIVGIALVCAAATSAFAGVPEAIAAAEAVERAKAAQKAAEAGLTKREKAELAVLKAQRKLDNLK